MDVGDHPHSSGSVKNEFVDILQMLQKNPTDFSGHQVQHGQAFNVASTEDATNEILL